MILKPLQLMNAMQLAGWKYNAGLIEGYAIATAESGKDTAESYTNTDGTVDRGLWMFNSRWHPEVSDACAYDETGICSSVEALRVYRDSGPDQWSAHANGRYRYFLEEARAAYALWICTYQTAPRLKSQIATDEATIATLQGTVEGLQTEVARLNAKIEAARTALA